MNHVMPPFLRALLPVSPPLGLWLIMVCLAWLGLAVWPPTFSLAAFFFTLGILHLVPGVLLVRRLLGAELSWPARLGWGFLLGVAMVGLLVTVASILDFSLGFTFWKFYAAAASLLLALEFWTEREHVLAHLRRPWRPDAPQVALGIGILAAAYAKLGSVAGQLAAPLHDPASHALMAKLIVEAGHIPWFQLPFRANPFFYPPGFPSLVAASHWVAEMGIPQLVLYWTNFGGLLTSIVAYFLVSAATKSRGAGLWAFGVLAFLSTLPAGFFYLAGKNSTVVSNVFFLASLLAILHLVRKPTLGAAFLTAALVAEMFVIHYEKIYFLGVFTFALAIVLLVKAREVDWRRLLPSGFAAAVFCMVLVAPWLYRIKWALDHAKSHEVVLVPSLPSPYFGAPLTIDSFQRALSEYWGLVSHFTEPTLAWFMFLAPLAILLLGSIEVITLVLFAALLPLLHPAIIEPFHISMAVLSYDRIAVHFAYLPVCLAAMLGLWSLWNLASRVASAHIVRWVRPALLLVTTSLLLYGGLVQNDLYRRYFNPPSIDTHDLEAFAWINANLEDRRPFIFPVHNPDHVNRRYFVGEAALYLPVFTSHDVVCHFLRIETPQIESEYRQYEAMLADHKPDRWAARHRIYTRNDRGYYDALNAWLENLEPTLVREVYRNGRVRILEVAEAVPASQAMARLKSP